MLPTRAIVTSSKDFGAAVAWAAKHADSRSGDVRAGVLLVMDGAGIVVSGFDGDTYGAIGLDGQVDTAGALVVSGSKLVQMAKSLPGGQVELVEEGARLSIACGSTRFALPTMPLEDYPRTPLPAALVGTVGALALREAVERVAGAVDPKNARPAYTAIHFDLINDRILLTATNGYRVGTSTIQAADWRVAPGMLVDGPREALMSARPLVDLVSTFTSNRDVQLGVGEHTISLQSAGTGDFVSLITRQVGVPFGDLRTGIATLPRTDHPVRVEPKVLLAALKVAMAPLGEKDSALLEFGNTSISVSGAVDGAEGSTDVPCDNIGEPGWFRINPWYLADALEACRGDVAEITLPPTSRKPVLVSEPGVDGFLHVIMPIHKPKAV